MNHRLFLTALLLSGSAVQAEAIPDDVLQTAASLRDAALEHPLSYELVRSLTQEVGPRPAGSAGDKAAVKWAVEKLEALGFSNVRAEPVTVPHWDRGTLDVRLTTPFAQPLVATALGGSSGTPQEGLEANVVRVESIDELRSVGAGEVQGRIVFIDHVMERSDTGRGYGTASTNRGCGHIAAADLGAVATVIRSAGTSTHRFAHTGSMRRGGMPGTIPAVALANADADILANALRGDDTARLRIHSTARDLPQELSANVIGEVPGRGELADEVVLMVAHLDSWDLGTGAIDDGAGVAIVTAAAKMIMDLDTESRRTLRVILYANEEFGLSGATAYLDAHSSDLDKHIIGMEADFGAGQVLTFSSRVAEDSLDLIDEIHELMMPLGINRGGNEAGGGADLGPLRKQGMPVFGFGQDGTYYFDYHHTADDTLDKIDSADLNQNVAAYVTAAYVAANVERDFGRLPIDDSVSSCPQ